VSAPRPEVASYVDLTDPHYAASDNFHDYTSDRISTHNYPASSGGYTHAPLAATTPRNENDYHLRKDGFNTADARAGAFLFEDFEVFTVFG
jgi:hypothetical protein